MILRYKYGRLRAVCLKASTGERRLEILRAGDGSYEHAGPIDDVVDESEALNIDSYKYFDLLEGRVNAYREEEVVSSTHKGIGTIFTIVIT